MGNTPTDQNTDLMQLRFRGALIGVLVGDCYGAPFEYGWRVADAVNLLNEFDQLSQSKQNLAYTDDTAMTIGTCKSLLKNKGFDGNHLAKQYARTYFDAPQLGYGAAVRSVFGALRDSNYRDPFGPAASQFEGKGSYGNGAAMRCIGVGLFGHKAKLDQTATRRLSESCARITHSHAHGVNGATLMVLACRYLLNLEENSLNESTFLEYLIGTMSELEQEQDRVYSQKLKIIVKIFDDLSARGSDVNQLEIVRLLGNDVAAHNSVPLAVYAFLRGVSKFNDSYSIDNEFLRTLHWAVSCGGDTDTIAAMACGLSGAYLGLEKIPEKLYKNCKSWREMISLADQLYALDLPEQATD